MSPYIAEFIGTMLLILFGNGVVSNVLLKRTKGNDAGWIVISAGWGVAVYIGAFCSNAYSAHTSILLLPLRTCFARSCRGRRGMYMIAQVLGAMIGALLVYLFYREHFEVTQDPDAKLACFSTAPNIRNNGQAFFCEMVGTFALILPIFLIASPSLMHGDAPSDTDPTLGLGSIGLLPVGLLVFGIGMSLGGTTGYAINPARDFGPRLVHAILPIRGKRDSDWSYAWVPVAGPIAGAILATAVFWLLSATENNSIGL